MLGKTEQMFISDNLLWLIIFFLSFSGWSGPYLELSAFFSLLKSNENQCVGKVSGEKKFEKGEKLAEFWKIDDNHEKTSITSRISAPDYQIFTLPWLSDRIQRLVLFSDDFWRFMRFQTTDLAKKEDFATRGLFLGVTERIRSDLDIPEIVGVADELSFSNLWLEISVKVIVTGQEVYKPYFVFTRKSRERVPEI